MKNKSTKHALLASILSIVMCFAMLIGSTFAWFTDEVKSGMNKIVAGNLDVELEYAVLNEDGSIKEWKSVEGVSLFDENAHWEPGHTEVVYLRVSNVGSLALKYQFGINVTDKVIGKTADDKDIDLSNFIEFGVVETEAIFADRAAARAAVNGNTALISEGYSSAEGHLTKGSTSNMLALVVYMPETVDNAANYGAGKTAPEINFGIKLVATQDAVEKDSFDENYDLNAEYPSIEVSTTEELEKALINGGNIKLKNDISIPAVIEIPAGTTTELDLNGKTITSTEDSSIGKDRPIVNYGTLVIKGNGTIDTTDANGYGAIRNYGTLTIENGTFKGNGLGGGSAVDNQTGGTTTINGGTYYASAAVMNRVGGTMIINGGDFEGVTNANEEYSSGIWSYAIRNYGDMTINDCNMHGSMNGGVACDQGTITINGGYFKVEKPEINQSFYVLLTKKSTASKIIVNGGTFEQTIGTDRLLGGFSGMPSWDATADLEANGFTLTGGIFILNGETVELS